MAADENSKKLQLKHRKHRFMSKFISLMTEIQNMSANHRTRRTCQKCDEDFFKFCGLLRKPKLYGICKYGFDLSGKGSILPLKQTN